MKKMKKILALTLVTVLAAASLVGCSQKKQETEEVKKGDPAKKALLVVSFGTSYNETRAKTIEAIEKKIESTFGKEYDVKRAFTSQFIIDKLAKRDDLKINNVKQAMDELVKEGYGTIVIQPTHIMNGKEYDELVKTVTPFEANFDSFKIGKPLLTSTEDYEKVTKIIQEEDGKYITDDTAVVFMGHGTEHFANATYACLDYHLKSEANKNYFVGTVEGYPTIKEVINGLNDANISKTVLMPFMIVAGDHANNDMAGDDEDSWKTQLKSEGFEVKPILKGLGEYEGIQNMFVEHAQQAIDSKVEAE